MKGGVAGSTARIAQFLSEGGYDVHVCVFPDSSETVPEGRKVEGNISIYWRRIKSAGGKLTDYMDRTRRMADAILELDAEIEFDLFHGVFLPAAFPCLQVARRRRRPVIASARGSDATLWLKNPVSHSIVVSVLRRADRITAPSSDSLRRLEAVADIGAKSDVVLNSVAEAPVPWSRELSTGGVVGTVSQFYPVKRIPLLIEAYARVPRALRSRLLLVGDFPEEAERQRAFEAMRRCGVADEVQVTGYVDVQEVRRYLHSMRVFVQCSASEGFSGALLEAASAGVPIVSTAVGGVAELLAAAPEAPSLLETEEANLAEAIERVLGDDDLAASMSTAARRAVRSFSAEREKNCWLEVHRKALEGSVQVEALHGAGGSSLRG